MAKRAGGGAGRAGFGLILPAVFVAAPCFPALHLPAVFFAALRLPSLRLPAMFLAALRLPTVLLAAVPLPAVLLATLHLTTLRLPTVLLAAPRLPTAFLPTLRLPALLLAPLLLAPLPLAAEPPRRVVSINLCTDQLAMLLAAPGQLVSVSHIARDPLSSAMTAAAAGYPVNHGRAEEVFALRPDLVLAGTYSNPATVGLLRRLGLRVETLPPAQDMEDVATGIRTIARALGRDAEGTAMADRFTAGLAALRGPARGRAALYYANSYSLGDRTLAGQILAAAGYANIASESGLHGGGTLPLETLIMARPDLIVQGERYAAPSRSEEVLRHPALAASPARRATLPDRDWICGTPHVLDALRALGALDGKDAR